MYYSIFFMTLHAACVLERDADEVKGSDRLKPLRHLRQIALGHRARVMRSIVSAGIEN